MKFFRMYVLVVCNVFNGFIVIVFKVKMKEHTDNEGALFLIFLTLKLVLIHLINMNYYREFRYKSIVTNYISLQIGILVIRYYF